MREFPDYGKSLAVGDEVEVYLERVEDNDGNVVLSKDKAIKIKIWGADKNVMTQFAANVRRVRPPDPYKEKGIRYQGEHVRQKAGKAGKIG